MLAIHHPTPMHKCTRVTPNILPAAIKHDGPVNAGKRYWDPVSDDANDSIQSGDGKDDIKTAYFRGRKLRGRVVAVPEGYEGVVLQKTDSLMPKPRKKEITTAEQLRRMEEGDEDQDEAMELDEQPMEIKLMEPTASFEDMIIWAHEMVPEDDDVYVKGVQEWIGFAETMHAYEKPAASSKDKTSP